MTINSSPWPCSHCTVKGPSFCRSVAPEELLATKLKSREIRFNSSAAAAGRALFRPEKSGDDIYILCEGWAFTYFRLPDGRRQIFSILLPGDVFSSRMVFGKEKYLSVASVTEVRFGWVNAADFHRELTKYPHMMKSAAMLCADEKQQCLETMVDLGQRNGEERIANFLVRLTERLDAKEIGGKNGRYPFPIRQSEIADAVSLTPVHVSRVMTKFRKEELIDVLWGELVIKDRLELNRRASVS